MDTYEFETRKLTQKNLMIAKFEKIFEDIKSKNYNKFIKSINQNDVSLVLFLDAYRSARQNIHTDGEILLNLIDLIEKYLGVSHFKVSLVSRKAFYFISQLINDFYKSGAKSTKVEQEFSTLIQKLYKSYCIEVHKKPHKQHRISSYSMGITDHTLIQSIFDFILNQEPSVNIFNNDQMSNFLSDFLQKVIDNARPIFDLIYLLIIKNFRTDNSITRSLIFECITNCLAQMNSSDQLICIRLIFEDAISRSHGLETSETRSLYYVFIANLSNIYKMDGLSDINNFFPTEYKLLFKNESSELCFFTLSQIFKQWEKFLNQQHALDLLNLIFLKIKIPNQSPILFSQFIKTLRDISNNCKLTFVQTHSVSIYSILSDMFKPPYNVNRSETALDVMTILLNIGKNDDSNFKGLFISSNLSILLHERNLLSYSESYLESVIYFASETYMNLQHFSQIFYAVFNVLFNCCVKKLDSYFDLLFKRDYSQEQLKSVFESILPYLTDNCKLYEKYTLDKKIFYSWTAINDKRIFLIFQKIFSMLLYKVEDSQYISIQFIKLIPLISVIKNQFFISSIMMKFSKRLTSQSDIMFSCILEKSPQYLLESYYCLFFEVKFLIKYYKKF
ncbi:hypothetical protein HZS_2410 [Henneguya salminicola]|nr:hypothetical protein HZS_2410 [Henneguya salminicola]